MKIAVVLERFPKLSERFIARELAALAELGLDFHIFTLREGEARASGEEPFRSLESRVTRLPGWHSPAMLAAKLRHPLLSLRELLLIPDYLASLPADPRRTLGAFLRSDWSSLLLRAAERAGCDLIWSQWASLPGAVGLGAAYMAGLPFALSCHAWDVFVNRALVAAQLRRARLVTVCSRAAREHLRELYGPAAGEVELVHHGMPSSSDAPAPRPERGDRPFRVLGAGRFVPKKGFHHLVAAAALGDFEVELMGDGPERKKLQSLVAERGLAGRVRFSGFADAAGLAAAFARADAIAAPSVVAPDGDRDGVPNVLLEASAAGLPVIASNAGGIPDFVEDGRTGLLVPPGEAAAIADAVKRLEADAELGARLVRGARELLGEKFSLEKNAARLAELLRAAAG